MLAAAGNTERSLGNTDVNAGTGGLSGSGTARGEAGQNGANGTGGSHGASGELGQGGQALLRGPGGNGEAPARRVGIEGLGAARALAVLSPTLQTFDAVYDRETRDRWRREDERRRADARGDYASNWRAALATLDTPVAVRPGETTALRTRASPFAAYIVQLHDRIHERFAEGFIGRVMAMPSNSPLHDPSLHTALEIVINRDGTIHRMAVAQTSGVLAFDVGAIDSVRASTPFPPPPEAILSGDGHVYVHWHFRRSVNFCNDARPFILRGRSTTPTPPATQPTRERTNEPEEGSGTVPPDGGAPPDSATEPPRRPPMVPDTPGAQRTASSHSIPGPSSAS
jgi:TonB family protein